MKIAQEIYTKVERARHHLETLERDISAFCDRKGYSLTCEVDIGAGEKTFVFTAIEPIPDWWPVAIGDIAHNLRSALDNCIYEISVKHTGSVVGLSEFPIFNSPEHFHKSGRGGGLYKIRGVPAKTAKVIEAMQPFNTRKDGSESILSILHELSNIDKHRTIHVCRMMPRDMRMEVVRDITFNGSMDWCMPLGILEDRTILARWKPTILEEGMDMSADFTFDIVFQDTVVARKSVIKTCDSLIKGVLRVFHYIEGSLSE